MARWTRRLGRWSLGVVGLLIAAVIGGGVLVRQRLVGSLPIMAGTVPIAGLEGPVTVDRDAFGVPVVTAASRLDAARALGFLHAQDRFFQMDLQRRQAAGELAALVGSRAIDADKTMRIHRFRAVSRRALAQASPHYRSVLDAYAGGVNAGLDALTTPPIEYFLLRTEPTPWMPEDSILTVLAMFNTLQGRQAQFEATFGTLAETMPAAMYDFLTARGSEWDAPVTGGRFTRPAIPSADVADLRQAPHVSAPPGDAAAHLRVSGETCRSATPWSPCLTSEEAAGLGSNNWAVAGTHTASGAALVANDMHLAINVPNIWYRASLNFPDPVDPAQRMRLAGVTLPGLPSLVVGSNGFVAWGFTNTGGDWSDLIVLEPDPREPGRYLTPHGSRAIDTFDEPIGVSSGHTVAHQVRWSIWGPIVRRDHAGREIAQRWVAHDEGVLASDITAPERARSLEEALHVAAGIGIPAQNFVAGDLAGRVGWTIAGPIPRRVGFDGSQPTSWADGRRRWEGYLAAAAFPRMVDPSAGRLWTANAPVVEGDTLAVLGEGGYADGIRARVIRDRLRAIDRATTADMLAVQLDDSALFHERWRRLVLDVLTPDALQADARRAEFRRLVEMTWTGRADPSSVAYRLVRSFRSTLSRLVFAALTAPARRADPEFDYTRTLRSEGPLWQLVTERPAHLLGPAIASWQAQLLAAVDTTIAELTADGGRLADRTWGEFNRALVVHPLGGAVPLAGRWLNMPVEPLPGDIYAPRAHSPRAGPSERLVVSPGREEEGLLHMPTGQSGHPLSPHYGDQHRAWLSGQPLPLLPGPPTSRVTLVPEPPARAVS
ncbi:MAG: penicillin acylase family protein [Acidobacteriota bacterium]